MTKILIVEDEEIIRAALRKLLERNEYKVSVAGSIKEATSKFTLSQFNLVISDLRLPGAPGTDLIKLAGDVPVLIMTSYASMQSAVDSMRMGAVDYIAKPFDHAKMLEAVEMAIRKGTNSSADSATPNAAKPSPNVDGMIGTSAAMAMI
jgi:DNA-binding NtrC family response regulator